MPWNIIINDPCDGSQVNDATPVMQNFNYRLQSLLPLSFPAGVETDNTYDLGSPAFRWRNLYLSGGIIMANATRVLAKNSVAQAIWPAPAWTTIIWDVEQYDLIGDYDNTTGVLTAVSEGYYEVYAGCSFTSNGFAGIGAFVNGVLVGMQASMSEPNNIAGAVITPVATVASCNLFIRVYLSIGDTLDLRTQAAQGGGGQSLLADCFINIIKRQVF